MSETNDTFNQLPPALRTALAEAFDITEAMPIQEAAYPLLFEGRNAVLQVKWPKPSPFQPTTKS